MVPLFYKTDFCADKELLTEESKNKDLKVKSIFKLKKKRTE
jgi:hypothetical protein